MKTRSTLPCRAHPNETAMRLSITHFYALGAYLVQMKTGPPRNCIVILPHHHHNAGAMGLDL